MKDRPTGTEECNKYWSNSNENKSSGYFLKIAKIDKNNNLSKHPENQQNGAQNETSHAWVISGSPCFKYFNNFTSEPIKYS